MKVYFTLINKEYVRDDNKEIVDIDTLMKYPHHIKDDRGWYDSSIDRTINKLKINLK